MIMTKTVEIKNEDNLDDFFTEDGLNNPIQLRIQNIPEGKHRVKLLSIELKKARINEKTKKAGVDRIECLFEYVNSNNSKCMPGTKGTIPYFKDEWQFGEKGLVKLAQEGTGDNTPISGGEAVKLIKELVGFEVDCLCFPKMKNGDVLKDKKGNVITEYNFGVFDLGE